MRKYDPIHGIDYLNDHYAILGVERDADSEDIKAAYREMLKQYHPDVIARAAPDLQKEAERKSELLILAYETLSDSERKQEYDIKLATFEPNLISTTGTPIIDPMKFRVDIDYLVGQTEWDSTEIIEHISQLSGYDETLFDIVQEKFKQTEKPGDKLRSAYKSALMQKNTYLSLMEGIAWDEAGISNQEDTKMLFYPDEHIAQRSEQAEQAKQQIEEDVEKRVLLLGSGEAPLLLTTSESYDSKAALANPEELKEEITDRATKMFEAGIPKIEELAKQRAEVLEELVALTDWEYLPEPEEYFKRLRIVVAAEDTILAELSYELESENVEPQLSQQFTGLSVEEFKALEHDGEVNVAILYHNNELDMMLEQGFIVNKHAERLSP